MCQRFVLPDQVAAEREFLPSAAWWNFAPKFNVSPTQYVPAVRIHDGQSEGVMLRWGLIPSWLEHDPVGPPNVTVGSKRIENSTIYGGPWTNGQRCILPVAGFYTWRMTTERYRQPFFVRLTDRSVFGIAAIWDRWVSEDDDVIEGCSLVCVAPNELVSDISTRRSMPAILRRRDYQTWLSGTPDAAHAALQTYRAGWMEAYPVSPRINSSEIDDAALIRMAS